MAKYSRAHERDECTKMWRGFWHSTFGILFCWVPVIGLVLSISGFSRQVVRMTEKYRVRMALFIVYGLLSLVISIGAIVGGLYAYSRDPSILNTAATWAWKQLTGQDALPGQVLPTDYTGVNSPGLGVYTDGTEYEAGDDMLGVEEYDDVPLDDEYNMGDEEVTDDETGDAQDVGDESAEYMGEYDDDMPPELDFEYELIDEEYTDVGDLSCVSYKVTIDKQQPTEADLFALFDDVIYMDDFELHNLHVYKDESETDGSYTIAALEQKITGEKPTITMK